jgi:hypothetical protein
MLDRLGPASSGDINIYGAARRVSETDRAGAFKLRAVSGVPATPPAEVLNALDSAQRVDHELRSRGLSVSFDTQADGGVRVSVVDSDGQVVRDLAPSAALDAISGSSPLATLTA